MNRRKRWAVALMAIVVLFGVLGLVVDGSGGRVLRFIGMGFALLLVPLLWSTAGLADTDSEEPARPPDDARGA